MIDFNKTPEEISQEMINFYEKLPLTESLGNWIRINHLSCIELAIDKVECMLTCCSNWDYRQETSKHAILKSVLGILNNKLN